MTPCPWCERPMDGMPGQALTRCRLCVARSLETESGWETHSEDKLSFVCRAGVADWQAWHSGFRIAVVRTREEAREAVRAVKAEPSLLDVYLVAGS